MGFVVIKLKGTGVGEDDALLMKAQVNRVGTQPMTIRRRAGCLAKQAQGAEGRILESKAFSENDFKRAPWALIKQGMGKQPFEAGCGKLAKGELVSRFGPDQFGYKQSEMHGRRAECGEERALECTIAFFHAPPFAAWPCLTN